MPRAVDEEMTKVSSWVSGGMRNEGASQRNQKRNRFRVTHGLEGEQDGRAKDLVRSRVIYESSRTGKTDGQLVGGLYKHRISSIGTR